jgi:hypothetical protein
MTVTVRIPLLIFETRPLIGIDIVQFQKVRTTAVISRMVLHGHDSRMVLRYWIQLCVASCILQEVRFRRFEYDSTIHVLQTGMWFVHTHVNYGAEPDHTLWADPIDLVGTAY